MYPPHSQEPTLFPWVRTQCKKFWSLSSRKLTIIQHNSMLPHVYHAKITYKSVKYTRYIACKRYNIWGKKMFLNYLVSILVSKLKVYERDSLSCLSSPFVYTYKRMWTRVSSTYHIKLLIAYLIYGTIGDYL